MASVSTIVVYCLLGHAYIMLFQTLTIYYFTHP